jgi:hypothetical protein
MTSSGDMPNVPARSRAGTMTGGWLTIRYCPPTTSPSLDSACALSRVCAFARFFCVVHIPFLSFVRLQCRPWIRIDQPHLGQLEP